MSESPTEKVMNSDSPITITAHTVKFGSDIYQLKNVTGFGGSVRQQQYSQMKKIVPWSVVWGLIIGGFVLFLATSVFWLLLLCLIGVAFLIANFGSEEVTKPIYGFGLYLNSGEKRVFQTTDKDFVKGVINLLYEALENGFSENEQYVINVAGGNVAVGKGANAKTITFSENENKTKSEDLNN